MWKEFLIPALLLGFLIFQACLFFQVNNNLWPQILSGIIVSIGLVAFSFTLGVKVGAQKANASKHLIDLISFATGRLDEKEELNELQKNDLKIPMTHGSSPAHINKRLSDLRPSLKLRPRGDSGLGLSPSPSSASLISVDGMVSPFGSTIEKHSSVSSPSRVQSNATSNYNDSLPASSQSSVDSGVSSFQRFRARSLSNAGLAATTPREGSNNSISQPSTKSERPATPITLAAAVAESSHDAVISESRTLLLQILGTEGGDQDLLGQIPWTLIRSGTSTLMWMSRNKSDAILLKGYSSTLKSPGAVMKWLFDNDLTTGLEGIARSTDTVKIVSKGDEPQIFVRRIKCQSGSMVASKRDFVVVTTVTQNPTTGSYIVSSRSVKDSVDFDVPLSQRKGKGIGSLITGRTSGEIVRGILHCSGFILAPRRSLNGEITCEISFALHADMMGSARINHSRIDPLAASLLSLCNRLQAVEASEEVSDSHRARPRQQSQSFDSIDFSSGPLFSDKPLVKQGSGGSIGKDLLPPQSSEVPSLDDDVCKHELLAMSNEASVRLRNLHSSFQSQMASHRRGKVLENPTDTSLWSFFYEDDDVMVGQLLSAHATSTGILASTCCTQAPPAVIKQLLLDHPDQVDGLLEGRTKLNQLDARTFVQWLAYRSIWPIGARDFLLVTTEDSFAQSAQHSASKEGFIICSTSIDSLYQEFDENDNNDSSSSQRYTRSSLRTAGYIGTPNAQGGTDLTVFVDVDVFAFIPSWLVQVLAQYGLSEMMDRIKSATNDCEPSFSIMDSPPSSKIDCLLSELEERDGMMSIKANLHEPLTPDASTGETASSWSVSANAQSSYLSIGIGPSAAEYLQENDEACPEEVDSSSPCASNQNASSFQCVTPRTLKKLQGTPSSKSRPWEPESGLSLAKEAKQLLSIYLGLAENQNLSMMKELGIEWIEKSKRNKTTVYSCLLPGNSWQAVRAVTSFQASKESILALLLNDDRISEFDEFFDSLTNISQVDQSTKIRRMVFKAIWPTCARDFIVLTTSSDRPDGTAIICSRSASDALVSPVKGYVRGFIQVTGYHIEPYETLSAGARAELPSLQKGGCKVSFVVHTELGGTLPASVINMLSVNGPLKLMTALDHLLAAKPPDRKSKQ